MPPPVAASPLPPRGGDASGPSEPVRRRLLGSGEPCAEDDALFAGVD